MPKASDYPLKTPVEDTDNFLGTDGSGAVKNYNATEIKDYVSLPNITAKTSGDDRGVNISEQFSVGAPSAGKEAVFGEGDSYPVPIAYHCTIANTTNMVITSAIDVATILQSDSGSTTGLFNGDSDGLYLLVGSDYRFGGVKAKMGTAGVVEPDQIIAEYLQATNTWTRSYFMATNADYPYEQKGNTVSTSSSKSEQWRFGFDPLNLPAPWVKVALTINGTASTKYWARFRIDGTITTDPQMEQIKLHTNRHEINADGFTEYFGRSRYSKIINTVIEANATKNPPNENVQLATGMTVVRTDNELANGASDGVIVRGLFPEGVDTSIPILIYVDWYAKDDSDGDVELELEVVVATEDFVYDGTASKVATTPVITSVTNDQYNRQTSIFKVIAQEAFPGDTAYGSLFRDATSGNTDDTYSSNIVIAGIYVIGHFWKP